MGRLVQRMYSGFTLIEVMLVIAVVAIMMLYFGSHTRDSRQQLAVVKTATEMQHWTEAASAYFIKENRRWPQTAQEIIDEGYMPEEAKCSPWIVTNPTDADCVSRSSYEVMLPDDDDRSEILTVYVDVTTEDIAQAISTHLPHAFHTQKRVYLTIPIPTRVAQSRRGLLIKKIKQQKYDTGYFISGSEKEFDNVNPGDKEIECPVGWGKNFRAGLSSFTNCLGIMSSVFGTKCNWAYLSSMGPVRRALVAVPQVNSSKDERPDRDVTWIKDVPEGDWEEGIRVQTDTNLFLVVGYPDTYVGDATVIQYCIPPEYDARNYQ